MHDLHHHQDRRRHLDVFKKKNFVPRGKSMLMNGWAHQRIRQPSAVFGTLLLQAGSHAGALPWHLAHTPLSQTCVARPQEAPVCSPQALHAWLAVAVATHFERQETNHSTCNHAFSHQPSSFTNMILPLEQNPKFLTNQSTPTKAQDLLQCKRWRRVPSNFPGILLSSEYLPSSSLNSQQLTGRYKGNASPHWDLTLWMPGDSRQASFHSPHLKWGLHPFSRGT